MSSTCAYSTPEKQWVAIAPDGPILEIWPNPGACSLLFYPGTMIEPGHYQIFIQALLHAGFSVYAIHFSGHGKAHKNRLKTFAHMLEEGLLAQKWIEKHAGCPVVICGHSQGGILAMAHAAQPTQARACFSLCSVFPDMPDAIAITRFRQLAPWREALLAAIRKMAAIAPWLPIPLPVYLSGRRIISGFKPPVYIGKGKTRVSYPLTFLHSLFSARLPKELRIPWWLICAKNDGLFSQRLTLETFNHVKAPYKKLVWLDDGGHLAIFNPRLAQYTAALCACASSALELPLHIQLAEKN